MQKTPLSGAVILGLTAALALAGCKKKDEANVDSTAPVASQPATPAPSEPAPAAAAVSVTGVTVGNNAAADKSVAPVATLGAKDKIIVSVKTDGTANNVPVNVKLTYQDGQAAGEQSATLNATGAETTNIEFTKASDWPAGKYTADVTVDGKPAGSQQFEVK
ncbi:hypothetical protein [[Pseudomonas] boreopolis]|uniref:Lipoprotein n=1 Tax=Xanthomonas boreopolis TaxID=86183 RepID=A0A919KI93_9XANT|nr:hypothetical protein GCM10009090_24950 [[Pseudomonas] boreopolis]